MPETEGAQVSARVSVNNFESLLREASGANFSMERSQTVAAKYHAIQNDIEKMKASKTDQPICRICLCEEDPDHELISPCSCMGGIRYIGISCLAQWLEGKKHFRETLNVNSYIWK